MIEVASVDSSSEFHNKHGEEHTMLRGHDMISLMNFGKSKKQDNTYINNIYIYTYSYMNVYLTMVHIPQMSIVIGILIISQ